MGALFAWPSELNPNSYGLALTFIVPAESCNLACGFCAIRQRREIEGTVLTVDDYVHFLDDVTASTSTAIAAIQGYEPLLPESWPFTSAILDAARRRGIPTGLVTNGILLSERCHDLANLEPTGVTVSIDSADPVAHDRLRGRPGALATTISGVRALAAIEGFADRLTITSVLLPHRRRLLEGMPDLLASLGLRRWVISPLLRIGKEETGGPVAEGQEIIADLFALEDLAKKAGIEVLLDDELGRLDGKSIDFRHLTIRRFSRPDGLVRLTPSGACSVGRDILRQVGPETPVWRPHIEAPSAFLKAILPTPEAIALLRAA